MKRIFFVFIIAFFVVVCSCANIELDNDIVHNTPGQFIKNPYIQKLTSESLVIMCETEKAIPLFIKVGNLSLSSKKNKLHQVRIKGLEPSTRYSYRVNNKYGGTFKTLPPENNFGKFKIVVFGDTQGGAKIGHLIPEENPDFLIHTGDLVQRGVLPWLWNKHFFNPLRGVLNNYCVYPVIGNHEDTHLSNNYYKYLSLPGNERWYSLNTGSAHFIFLDSNARRGAMQKQVEWLKGDLAADAHSWKIAILHHPILGANGRQAYRPEVADSLLPVLLKYGVKLIFSGHDHQYNRDRPVYDSKGRTFVQIISGGGGGELSNHEGYSYILVGEKRHHIVSLEISPEKISGKAIDIDNNVFDIFTYTKEDFKNFPKNGLPLKRVIKEIKNKKRN